MSHRVHNFNPGPATLPLPVLERIREDLPAYRDEGLSVLEMSHRSGTFDELVMETEALVRELGGFSEECHVLFLQGGATAQFAAIPLNLSLEGKTAEYVNSGSWSQKAIAECAKLGKPHRVIAASEESGFDHVPTQFDVGEDAAYLHITSNNTIYGTQWPEYPDTGDVPLAADMSSDIFCRPLPAERLALVYAGAQKNIGAAGVTLVIIRDDLLVRSPDDIPTMLHYPTHAAKHSLYNTPNCFGIYLVNLVLQWIRDLGGLAAMEERNRKKAETLYAVLDASRFYCPHARAGSRSMMNITWNLPTPELEAQFVAEAAEQGMVGLKGHRSVGGVRASIYNAMTQEGVDALAQFMQDFERARG